MNQKVNALMCGSFDGETLSGGKPANASIGATNPFKEAPFQRKVIYTNMRGWIISWGVERHKTRLIHDFGIMFVILQPLVLHSHSELNIWDFQIPCNVYPPVCDFSVCVCLLWMTGTLQTSLFIIFYRLSVDLQKTRSSVHYLLLRGVLYC